MKFIKKIIIFLIILILIIVLIMFGINTYDRVKNPEAYDPGSEQDISYNVADRIEKVTNYQSYYTINNIIKRYVSYLQQLNGDYYIDEGRLTTSLADEKQSIKQSAYNKVINMLDKEYTTNIQTKLEDVVSKTNKYIIYGDYKHSNVDYLLLIEDMYVYEMNPTTSLYIVNVTINSEETKMMIKLDDENKTFSLFLEDYMDKYNYSTDMNKNEIKISDSEIVTNKYNTFKYATVTNETIAKGYFSIYKTMTKSNIEKAYNYLDEEYRNKRFGSLDNYKKYIKEENSNLYITEYLINRYDTYTECVCKDQYDNLYIFKETSIMDYTITLDTYTIEQAKFVAEYSKANDQKKVMMNIDKFFQMINAKDYTAAYNCLADSFKNNYFKTEASFEQYVKTNLYRYNTVTYKTYTDEVAGIHQYKLTITNKQNANSSKQFNIVMKLNSGTDFEMSFEV